MTHVPLFQTLSGNELRKETKGPWSGSCPSAFICFRVGDFCHQLMYGSRQARATLHLSPGSSNFQATALQLGQHQPLVWALLPH